MFSLVRDVTRQASEPQWQPSPPCSQPDERADRRKRRAGENHRSPEFAHGLHQFQFYLIFKGLHCARPRKLAEYFQ
jgi:hypothetical protein